MTESGIDHFKCSLNELEMLLEAGAPNVFLAYPLVPAAAERVAELAAGHPRTRLLCQVASPTHAQALASACRRRGVEIDCLIDLDVGEHRTGTGPEVAVSLSREIVASGCLRFHGVHGYDGHNHSAHAGERARCARDAMAVLADTVRSLERAGMKTERVITAGSPGFLLDLDELLRRHALDAHVTVSPGTWIYWDTKYDGMMPGMFDIAAVVFARVMDLPAEDRVTLDLGHKRWAIDQGPVERFSVPDLEFVSASEEHTVLRSTSSRRPDFNEPVLVAPHHVCPTINLWEAFTLIDESGNVEAELPVTSRNR